MIFPEFENFVPVLRVGISLVRPFGERRNVLQAVAKCFDERWINVNNVLRIVIECDGDWACLHDGKQYALTFLMLLN